MKVNPLFGNFFQKAAAAGYGTNEIVSFLQDMFSKGGESEIGNLRPDELANMQIERQQRLPLEAAKNIPALAGKLGAIGTAVSAIPGLVEKGSGLFKQKEKPLQRKQPTPQDIPGFNGLIAKYPKLGTYIDSLIKSGQSPMQAANTAMGERKFSNDIANIESESEMDFPSLIDFLFQGSSINKNAENPEQQTNQKLTPLLEALQQVKAVLARKQYG